MSVTPRIAAAAMLAGLAVGTASTAWAAPTMIGHYIYTSTEPHSGRSATADWYFTPCGDGCASVATTPGGSAFGQERLVNGQWTLDAPAETVCPDGTKIRNSGTTHYTWDPNTLAGTAQVTEKIATCGATAPESWTNNMQLTKAA
jgi:hypothetical protein